MKYRAIIYDIGAPNVLILYGLCQMTRAYVTSRQRVNPYSAELLLYKPWRPKGFFNLKSS